jgi:hypothetical protein
MQTKVNRSTAEQCVAAIRATFKAYLGDGEPGPALVEDFDGRPWTIMWEGGPYEWVFLLGGGVDEEMAALAEEFGATVEPTPPTDFPPGVMVEPINHYSVGVYPA